MVFTIKEVTKGKAEICQKILDALPNWFALQDAKENYVKEVGGLPMLGCFDNKTDVCVGLVSLKNTTPNSSEIFVMGLYPKYHQQGGGASLVRAAEASAKSDGKEFLFVKTLSSDHPDPYYAKTRKFYTKIGFKELEVLPMVWGEENPCLIMVKSI